MRVFNIVDRFSIVVLALLILAGCSSAGPPVSLSQIPVPPDLAVYEGAEESTFDTLIIALEQAFEIQPQKADIQYYWMPEAITWEQVEQFYQSALANTDWTIKEPAAFNIARWMRDSSAGKQVFVVSAIPISAGEGHILVVILASP